MRTPKTAETAAPLNSVLRTEELSSRPQRSHHRDAERALRAIAQHMADSPRTALQKIADTALQMCQGGSAGISLFLKANGEFYWAAVAGAWKPHVGQRVPRRYALGGTVFDRNAAQLFTHPERRFRYLTAFAPRAEEALVVPFHVAGEPVGTLWIIAHEAARKFDAQDARLLENLAPLAAAIYPLGAALEVQEEESQSLRDANEQLVLSSVHQHELTELAREAEKFARDSQEQLSLELVATRSLQETSTKLIGDDNPQLLYEQILDTAVAIMRSQYASIQMFDPERGSRGELLLLGHRGFDPDAARFWEWVPLGSKSTCGQASRSCERVIVHDVRRSEALAGSDELQTYLRAGIYAAQSTPLISRTGRLLGMLSTHWRSPHQPSELDIHFFDVLARQAADFIDRSHVHAALQESGRHFRALAEAVPVIVWTADANGWIDWYNNRWYEYTGQTPEEALGWGWQAAHHPEDFQRVMEAWPAAIAGGEPLEIEFRLRRHDGVFHHFLTRIRPFRNDRGEVVRWYGSNVDIQEHKTALEQSQRVAETLQGRFLPRTLPRNGKVRFDASYTAAEEGVLVGGDWFEAMQLPDGRYLISVGDVTGHGLDASVIADRLRQAITDFGFTESEPAVILARANRILRFQNPDVYATAVVGLLDRDCNRLTYATAGHPSPLFATTAAAPAQELRHGGLPLGFDDDLGLVSYSIGIQPGAVLAFYTDGLTEFARNVDAAESVLKTAVAQVVGDTSFASPAVAIKTKVLGKVRAPDDVALLVAQFGEFGEEAAQDDPTVLTKTWRFHSSDAHAAHISRRALVAFIRRFAADPSALFTAEIILGEILANSVEHAPGLVEVQIDWTGEKPVLTVVDTGPGLLNRILELPQDMLAESGRGLFLMNALSEELSFSISKHGGTELRAVLPLTRSAGGSKAPSFAR